MKEMQIIAPKWASAGDIQSWHATYQVTATDNVRLLAIESRSAIDVVLARICSHSTILGTHPRYYVSSPNFGIAIPCIGSLAETNWITEHLIGLGMPTPDAVTVAQVLRDLGNF
jgi:hypothetical protein